MARASRGKKKVAARRAWSRPLPPHPLAKLFQADQRVTPAHLAAFDEAVQRFGHRPGVTGIDLGYQRKEGRETGRIVVRIHVQEKIPRNLLTAREIFPRRLAGVPVDVVQARYEHTFVAGTENRRARRDPVQPGISVGHPEATAGTFGALVKDITGDATGLLSAAHVIAPPGAAPGDSILQPGPADGGIDPDDAVAELGRTDFVTDSAVAWLGQERGASAAIFESGVVPKGVRDPVLGDILVKSGRSTGLTTGRVDGIGGPYGGVGYSFRLVPANGTGPLVLDGDSGAVWYDPQTSELVGLNCMGPPFQETADSYAIASRMPNVIGRLSIKPA